MDLPDMFDKPSKLPRQTEIDNYTTLLVDIFLSHEHQYVDAFREFVKVAADTSSAPRPKNISACKNDATAFNAIAKSLGYELVDQEEYDYYVKRRTENEFCDKYLTEDILTYESSAHWGEMRRNVTEVYPKRDMTEADHQEYYDQGVIPKKDLQYGEAYAGTCRNASIAVWDGQQFWYWRTKFSSTFRENINVIEDDNGYDLFLPMRQITREEIAEHANGVNKACHEGTTGVEVQGQGTDDNIGAAEDERNPVVPDEEQS